MIEEQKLHTQSSGITVGVQRTILENRLTVLTKEVHDRPIVSCFIWYRVGSRNEELGQTGKSHFLEHILFKGTDRYHKGEIDLITLKNGGANNAFTSNDFTAYYFNFASDRWRAALEIEASRMRNNIFIEEEFNSEKQVVIEELLRDMDEPWEALSQEVWATSFKQHPYHNPTIGWLDDLVRASAEDLKRYYDQWYHPRNAILVIVGDIESDRTLSYVRELFGPIPGGPEPPEMMIKEEPQRGERRVIVRKETLLERMMIGYHAPEVAHADSYPLQVVSTLLSTGKTSRFYRRLQEREQSVTFAVSSYDEAIDPTLFLIRAEVKPGRKLEDVERAITEEIDALKEEQVSAEELDKAKRLIEARFILGSEEVFNQAMMLGLFETIYRFEYLQTYLDYIKAVSPEDIQRVVRRYLNQDNRTVGYLIGVSGNS